MSLLQCYVYAVHRSDEYGICAVRNCAGQRRYGMKILSFPISNGRNVILECPFNICFVFQIENLLLGWSKQSDEDSLLKMCLSKFYFQTSEHVRLAFLSNS